MSDRINYITVVLSEDKRDDDCEHILHAIRMIKGVLSVKANVASHADYMAETRATWKLREKLSKLVDDV